MSARFLVRLDDACPTMHAERWAAVEAMLDRLAIKPIVAVVPDNRDPELMASPPDPDFWTRVRAWESKGWSIAMHGLHHVYHAIDRRRLIVPLHDRSEVAGLGLDAQSALLQRSWEVFAQHSIAPTVWVAPSHAFDRDTVRALHRATPIRLISDGFSVDHFWRDGFTWIPQQLWAPARRKRGLWTICLHPATMSDAAIVQLETTLSDPFYRQRMVALADLQLEKRRPGARDLAYRIGFFARRRAVTALLPAYHFAKRLVAARG